MDRRSFLKGLGLAVAVAPAIIRTPGLIMPIKPVLGLPEKKIIRPPSMFDLKVGDLVTVDCDGYAVKHLVVDAIRDEERAGYLPTRELVLRSPEPYLGQCVQVMDERVTIAAQPVMSVHDSLVVEVPETVIRRGDIGVVRTDIHCQVETIEARDIRGSLRPQDIYLGRRDFSGSVLLELPLRPPVKV